MSKEFFERFPTYLGLLRVPEIQALLPLTGAGGTDKRIDFVLDLYATAVKVGKKFNLNPLIILAQASLESGWGTSTLAKLNHNFFGMTAYGGKNEYWDGTARTSTSSGLKFRNYKSVEDGLSDFARTITKYYPKAAALSNDVVAYATAIAASPYINEKNGDNRTKYRQVIITSANSILDVLKKKVALLN
jgi:flagellum-specific peptidoglycan hydrolase FlgJ